MATSEKILYAAYGEMAIVLPELLGRDLGPGRFATLRAVELGTQAFVAIPDVVRPDAPVPLSPQQILSDNWDGEFRAYVARPSQDPSKQTPARVFAVTPDEREIILDEWNLGTFGWFSDHTAIAQPLSGASFEVHTDVVRSGALTPVAHNGYAIQPPLNGGKIIDVARLVRETYLARSQEPVD